MRKWSHQVEVRERLEYTRCMLEELCAIAQSDRHALLTYLLEMAYVEASDMLRAEADDRPRDGLGLAA